MTSQVKFFLSFVEMVILIVGTYKIIRIPATRSQQEFFEHHYPKAITAKGNGASRTVIWYQPPLGAKRTKFLKFINNLWGS